MGRVIGLSALLVAAGCSSQSGAPRSAPTAALPDSAGPAAPPIPCSPGFADREGACARVAPQVSIGSNQICAALVDGRVFCWGRDDGGQFEPSDGVGVISFTPKQIDGVTGATSVAASGFESCAVVPDGEVVCWGGITGAPLHRIEGVRGAARLVAGYRHFCASIDRGADARRLACWGSYDEGGARSDTMATLVDGVDDVIDVAAAQSATCALRADHTVRCFGLDAPLATTPPPGLPPITRLLATPGDRGVHLCGLAEDGALVCWGKGDRAHSITRSPTGERIEGAGPFRYELTKGARDVAIGRDFACSLSEAGAVRCTSADLGATRRLDTSPFVDRLDHELASFSRGRDDPPVALHAGGRSLCADYASGNVRCVGDNLDGQVGTGASGTRFEPKVLPDIARATHVVLTRKGGCAATAAGLRCWGFGDTEVTDDNFAASAPRPVSGPADVTWLGRDTFTGDRPLAISGDHKLWLLGENFEVRAKSADERGAMTQVEGLPPIVHTTGLALGMYSQTLDYATTVSGDVLAIRATNEDDGARIDAEGVPIVGLTDVRQVARVNQAACALRANGTVVCWRLVSPFTPGVTKITPTPAATRPKLLDIPGIDTGEDLIWAHAFCVRRKDGRVLCFTLNDSAPAPGGPPLAIVRPPTEQPMYQGSATLDGILEVGAVTTDGRCLYQGNRVQNDTFSPFAVGCPDTRFYSVMDGGCELRATGEVACWGANRAGRIGTGDRTLVMHAADALLPAIDGRRDSR